MKKSDYRWEFKKDSKGEWRWTKFSVHNGKIVGASSEGFPQNRAVSTMQKLWGIKSVHSLCSRVGFYLLLFLQFLCVLLSSRRL